jgi:hypothetical protein
LRKVRTEIYRQRFVNLSLGSGDEAGASFSTARLNLEAKTGKHGTVPSASPDFTTILSAHLTGRQMPCVYRNFCVKRPSHWATYQ